MNTINLTAAQKKKIKRCIKGLNDVRAELQHQNPNSEIRWYLEGCDNLNLMSEESHTGSYQEANQEGVIELFQLERSSGGGW